jgi:hypothetical protein
VARLWGSTKSNLIVYSPFFGVISSATLPTLKGVTWEATVLRWPCISQDIGLAFSRTSQFVYGQRGARAAVWLDSVWSEPCLKDSLSRHRLSKPTSYFQKRVDGGSSIFARRCSSCVSTAEETSTTGKAVSNGKVGEAWLLETLRNLFNEQLEAIIVPSTPKRSSRIVCQ